MIGFKPILAILFICAVLGAAMVGVFVLPNQQPNERVRANRSFERTVAEGMRLYNSKTGVDSIRFDACRIEKLRMGVFILGAFDVLCLDGLVLNLPLPAEDSAVQNAEGKVKSDGRGVGEALAGLLPQSFLQWAGVSTENFAGIEISGLQVNKVESQREVPVFAADGARNYREMLKLKNCRVFNEGRTNAVGVAYLTLKPEPALVWKDGVRLLDDLLPDFSETKGKEI